MILRSLYNSYSYNVLPTTNEGKSYELIKIMKDEDKEAIVQFGYLLLLLYKIGGQLQFSSDGYCDGAEA